MNEFDETPSIYVWPKDHEDGTPYPDGFWARLRAALNEYDIEWERV